MNIKVTYDFILLSDYLALAISFKNYWMHRYTHTCTIGRNKANVLFQRSLILTMD